ncbi:MAG: F-box/WD40 repeat-containing protein, partial [Rhabdochlamydiaceae bacterium]
MLISSPFVEKSHSKDIFRCICSHLDPQVLVQLASTSRYLYTQILSDSLLWKSLLQRHFPGPYVDFQLKTKGPLDLYKHLTNVQHNMKAGKYRLQTLEGHQHSVNSILVFGDKLISASSDRTIKIWDLSSGKVLQTLEGHQRWVNSILVDRDKLISASSDCTIKIWDLSSGKVLQTLDDHRDMVNSILVDGDKLISASGDRTIKIWDLSSGKVLQTLEGHQGSVTSILVDGDKLISASADNTINIWDFSFPSLSPYSKQVVEQNLAILGEMAHAEYNEQPEIVKELAQKLDPAFRERLKQHVFKVGDPSTYSAEVILRV